MIANAKIQNHENNIKHSKSHRKSAKFLVRMELVRAFASAGQAFNASLGFDRFFEAGNEKNIKKQTLRSTGGTHQKLALLRSFLCPKLTMSAASKQMHFFKLAGSPHLFLALFRFL